MDFEKMALTMTLELYGETPSGWTPEIRDAVAAVCRKHLSAAFAAGREAMRSECVETAESLATDTRTKAQWGMHQGGAHLAQFARGADAVVAAIRALPGKEG